MSLIAMPIAINQYPDFFNDNPWVLPASVLCVIACWIVPLLFHNRAIRLYRWIGTFSGGGKAVTGIVVVTLLGSTYYGGKRLLAFHKGHLQAALAEEARRQEPAPATSPSTHDDAKMESDLKYIKEHLTRPATSEPATQSDQPMSLADEASNLLQDLTRFIHNWAIETPAPYDPNRVKDFHRLYDKRIAQFLKDAHDQQGLKSPEVEIDCKPSKMVGLTPIRGCMQTIDSFSRQIMPQNQQPAR